MPWRGAEKIMEEKEILQVSQVTTMTDKEQKILNTRLRLALRTGELPFTFTDDQEKDYRKIVYSVGVEMGKKFTANKVGNFWTISEAVDQVE